MTDTKGDHTGRRGHRGLSAALPHRRRACHRRPDLLFGHLAERGFDFISEVRRGIGHSVFMLKAATTWAGCFSRDHDQPEIATSRPVRTAGA